jgi:hypothetical protein
VSLRFLLAIPAVFITGKAHGASSVRGRVCRHLFAETFQEDYWLTSLEARYMTNPPAD